MKKKVITLSILFLVCTIKVFPNYTTYLNFQTFKGYRLAGIGTRMRSGFNAIDLCACASPFHLPKSLKTYHLSAQYLFYPRQLGLYIGTGAGLFHDPESSKKMIRTFEAVIGLQLGSKLFVQLNGIIPLKKGESVTKDNYKQYLKKSRVWPGLSIGLGF